MSVIVLIAVTQYYRSSVVEKVILGTHAEGRKFTVIVVDSRPMLEGGSHVSLMLTPYHLTLSSRQKASFETFIGWYILHIFVASCNCVCHHRGLSSAGGRTLTTFKRRCILSCRDGLGSDDGKAALDTRPCVLRDVQVLRGCAVRQFHQERIGFVRCYWHQNGAHV
jgi:hypothetical protein